MANTKGPSNIRNLMYSGKQALLPPKSPFPSIFPSYVDYVRNPAIGSKVVQNTREANAHHQRTSSESFLVEEKPSWLDDLLNEPDTPVYRGHRRSSSDSFTLLDATNVSSMNYAAEDDSRYRNMISAPSLRSLDSNLQKNSRRVLFNAEMMNVAKMKSNPWDSLNALNNPSIHASVKDNSVRDNSGSVCTQKEADGVASTAAEKHDVIESALNDSKTSPEKNDNSNAETDTKRAKQQFAQRSRVRKLQYISELERNVQTLQAEGSKVSAELKFLNQQNLILSMENKALKQRLENLAQEQLIKYLEQEVLEREIGRLRALYQQQRQPQASSSHRRTNSRDLDSQFSNLSLKHEDSSSGRDPMTGPLHI